MNPLLHAQLLSRLKVPMLIPDDSTPERGMEEIKIPIRMPRCFGGMLSIIHVVEDVWTIVKAKPSTNLPTQNCASVVALACKTAPIIMIDAPMLRAPRRPK